LIINYRQIIKLCNARCTIELRGSYMLINNNEYLSIVDDI
jgi:hypothetical protein